ncbi:DUF1302 domain-containing protein [Amphritea atlantica]|uniref:DUF1302 domain-containing protein n=2 Tax=Amphritea TaxID=515417 RepID=UPI00339D996E
MMNFPSRRKQSYRLLKQAMTATAVSICFSQGAYALSFEPTEELHIDWDTTLNYGASWRVEDRDERLVDPTINGGVNVNKDDGDRNFDKGLISNRISVTTEMDINYRNDYGMFLRGRAYYDDVYHQKTDNDSPGTFNGASHNYNEFNEETTKRHGDEIEMLDYFVYGNFDLSGKNLNVRLGSQVVSWGESVFVVGGISTAQSPLDATQLGVPGVELKDIFLPQKQLYMQLDLSETMSVESYYQFEWDKTRLVAAGSYFSADDYFDEGGEQLFTGLGTLTRGDDTAADNSGQYGVAFRYLAEDLNNTEFGFYYLNYHDKLPVFDWSKAFSDGTYALRYAEDIKLYGASFGTVIGDTNVSGEYSYRDGMLFLDSTPGTTMPIKGDLSTVQLSAIHVFGPSFLADDTTFTGELGYNKVHGVKASELLSNDTDGWGFAAKFDLAYQQVMPGIDMNIPIIWNHDLAGNLGGDSAVLATFDKGKDVVSVGAEFTYLNNFKTDIKYTSYLGSADEDPQADRDFVSISAKYSF